MKRMKGKKYMTILVNTEKVFDKIKHPFMIETLKKLGIERTNFSIIEATYEKVISCSVVKM